MGTASRGRGMSTLGILGLAALAAIVVGGIMLAPDIKHYLRIRNM